MNASGSPASSPRSLGPIALIALLVASLVVGILVYRARTPDLALEVTSFPRIFEGKGTATFEFFVRFDDPAAVVEVVGRNQVVARTLDPALEVEAGEPIKCVWDGLLDAEGAEPGASAGPERALPGRYRLRVSLPGEDRQMVFPRRLNVTPGDALNEARYVLKVAPCGTDDSG